MKYTDSFGIPIKVGDIVRIKHDTLSFGLDYEIQEIDGVIVLHNKFDSDKTN